MPNFPICRDVVEAELQEKRFDVSANRLAEIDAHHNVHGLLRLCEDFEAHGQGQDCSMLQRVRGLDILYNPRKVQATAKGRRGSVEIARQGRASFMSSEEPKVQEPRLNSKACVKATAMFHETPFFKKIEAEFAGTIAAFAKSNGVTFVNECAGQVMFRQQDPGANCYIVTSGSVGVYIGEYATEKRTPREQRIELLKMMTLTETLTAPTDSSQAPLSKTSSFSAKWKPKRKRSSSVEKKPRFKTSEGFSSFSEETFYGDQVRILRTGDIFGELALQNDDPRAASIRCEEDSSFLVIHKKTYREVMGYMLQKVKIFDTHLPSLSAAEYSGSHPSSCFRMESFEAGHVFWREGIYSLEPEMFLISDGSVELWRYEVASANPTYVLASRPLDRSSWKAHCVRPKTGVAGSEPDEEPWWGSSASRGQQSLHDTLRIGDAFCSLAFIPLKAREAFTAVVAEGGCKVYRCAKDDLLGLSQKQLKAVRQEVMQSMTKRLSRLGS